MRKPLCENLYYWGTLNLYPGIQRDMESAPLSPLSASPSRPPPGPPCSVADAPRDRLVSGNIYASLADLEKDVALIVSGEVRGDCRGGGFPGFPAQTLATQCDTLPAPLWPSSRASLPPPFKTMLCGHARGWGKGGGVKGRSLSETKRLASNLWPVRFSSVWQSIAACAFMRVFHALLCQPPLPKCVGRATALRMYKAVAPSPSRSPRVSTGCALVPGNPRKRTPTPRGLPCCIPATCSVL